MIKVNDCHSCKTSLYCNLFVKVTTNAAFAVIWKDSRAKRFSLHLRKLINLKINQKFKISVLMKTRFQASLHFQSPNLAGCPHRHIIKGQKCLFSGYFKHNGNNSINLGTTLSTWKKLL